MPDASMIRHSFICLIFIFFSFGIFGQINAPKTDYTFTLHYENDTLHADSVFVFYSPDKNNKKIGKAENVTVSGGLIAKHSSGRPSVFKWFVWDSIQHVFIFQKKDSAEFSGFENIYETGCYRVEIKDSSDLIEIYHAWVYIDLLIVYAFERALTKKDSCENIILDCNVFSSDFVYSNIYDTSTYKTFTIPSNPTFNWRTADRSSLSTDKTYAVYPTDKEMQKDTRFYIDVKNSFKQSRTANYYYKVRIPVANNLNDHFLVRHSKEPDQKTDAYFAPDSVSILHKGLNVDSVMWLFADTGNHDYKDAKVFTSEKYMEHVYYYPGTYEIKILSKNNVAGCLDSVSTKFEIQEPSIDLVPNVFTPNGDSYNPYWVVKGKSIKWYRIYVFDRWGKVVFKKEVDNNTNEILVEWDGSLNREKEGDLGITPKVPSGAYYYIIEAKGYDGAVVAGKKVYADGQTSSSGTGNENGTGNKPKNAKKYKYAGTLYIFRD